jgi:hypothetical protein
MFRLNLMDNKSHSFLDCFDHICCVKATTFVMGSSFNMIYFSIMEVYNQFAFKGIFSDNFNCAGVKKTDSQIFYNLPQLLRFPRYLKISAIL